MTASLRPVTQLGISAPVRHNLMDRGLTLARKCQEIGQASNDLPNFEDRYFEHFQECEVCR